MAGISPGSKAAPTIRGMEHPMGEQLARLAERKEQALHAGSEEAVRR